LHRRESSTLFAIAQRSAHFDKTKHHANEHGHRPDFSSQCCQLVMPTLPACCDVGDRSQIHDDNVRRYEKIKSRRIVSTLRLLNFLTNYPSYTLAKMVSVNLQQSRARQYDARSGRCNKLLPSDQLAAGQSQLCPLRRQLAPPYPAQS
jgi:hypothetical protein